MLRVCGTGISLADYREAVQTDSPIDWRCAECMSESLLPVAESTPVDFVANSVLESDIDEPTADEPVPDSVAAAENIFQPASSIVEEILLQELTDAPCPSLPKPEYIARTANRFPQRLRPKDPTDLAFELEHDHLPAGFFRADVQVHGRRHLMFATEQQLQYLARAKNWYVDGTFKLCRPPFTQLLTVNAFVKQDDHAKQVPLLFVVMSGKNKMDYRKVFKQLLEILPTAPAVKRITLDFEKAVWAVLRNLFPDVKQQGCAFHWTQALWRKVR